MELTPELQARVKAGLACIAQDINYTIAICEAATAKIEKRKKLNQKSTVEKFTPTIHYCNDCGRSRGWSLTMRLDTYSNCNLCGNYQPCSTTVLTDTAEMIAAWKNK